MTDDAQHHVGEAIREPSDEELGPAVDLSPPDGAPDDQFAGRVRRAVHRRLFGSWVVEFCIFYPAAVALELAVTIGSAVRHHIAGGDR